MSSLPQSISKVKNSHFQGTAWYPMKLFTLESLSTFATCYGSSALFSSVSILSQQIRSTSIILSPNGSRGKFKWTVTLTSVFTVPTKPRGVLWNQQHASLRIFPKLSLRIMGRKVYRNWACHLYRDISLYLHALWSGKQVSRNEKKLCESMGEFCQINFSKQFLLCFSALTVKLTGHCSSWKKNLGFN